MVTWWSPLLLLLLAVACSFAYLLRCPRSREKGKKSSWARSNNELPPGPRGLPIFGILHLLGRHPHRTLHRWAKDYGPIMHIKLGLVSAVVVSSPQAAEQFLKTHDLVFASRPMSEVGRFISYDSKGVAASPYSPYWRNVRKLCTLELFSNIKIDSFKPTRREEVSLLVGSIKDASKAHVVVDLTTQVASLIRDITCRMAFGKKYMDENLGNKRFKEVLEELVYVAAAFNISEYIPCTREMDLQGVGRRLKAISKVLDEFFNEIIDKHLEVREEQRRRDFVDFMLSFMESNDNEFQFDRTNIKALMVDVLVGGLATSSVSIDWTLSELMKHPRVMKKAQEELESVVGKDRKVDESDLLKLDYLDMVVKESMRLHPASPLILPHESTEDCTVDGFHIPKGTRVIVNAWAIGQDPDAWAHPEEFYPERFMGTSIDVRGRDFQLLPFGSGRRGCPAIQLSLTMIRLVLAQLIHCFEWELPNGLALTELDMSENFGLALHRANHLLAIPTYRLTVDGEK